MPAPLSAKGAKNEYFLVEILGLEGVDWRACHKLSGRECHKKAQKAQENRLKQASCLTQLCAFCASLWLKTLVLLCG